MRSTSCSQVYLIYLKTSSLLSLPQFFHLILISIMYRLQSLARPALFFAAAVLGAPAPQASYYSAPASLETPASAPPTVPITDVTSHGPFTGSPTTTGALATDILSPSIPALPPNPAELTYPSDGKLHNPEPAPYTPAGRILQNIILSGRVFKTVTQASRGQSDVVNALPLLAYVAILIAFLTQC